MFSYCTFLLYVFKGTTRVTRQTLLEKALRLSNLATMYARFLTGRLHALLNQCVMAMHVDVVHHGAEMKNGVVHLHDFDDALESPQPIERLLRYLCVPMISDLVLKPLAGRLGLLQPNNTALLRHLQLIRS